MYINNSKTIVIKIGSSNLVDSRGQLKEKWLKSFVKDVKKFKKKGKNFVIVSSGAIALGQNYLKVKKKKIEDRNESGFSFDWSNSFDKHI